MSPAPQPLLIACLCAEWCGTCREYRAVFQALMAAGTPGQRFRWLDIEDESDVAGDVDIETFPTLLIARPAPGGRADVLFAGPVLPREGDARRLIDTLTELLAAGRRPAPLQLPAGQLAAFETVAARLLAEPA